MNLYSYTTDSMTELANQIKEVLIARLVADEVAQGKTDDLCAKYVVVIAEPTAFGKIWRKVRKTSDKGLIITVLQDNSPP